MADIIMPALGMVQDTGKLVQWLKAPGDLVAKGDVLFEVETDKAVMEVEAQADGFLKQVSAADGEDVPVGQVIGVISATADNAVDAPLPTAKPATALVPAPEPTLEPAQKSAAPIAVASAGRIFKSPKAWRMAKEEGLDLGQLVAAGVPMPYHVSDLETLRTMPAPVTLDQTVEMVATKQITARCAKQGTCDFIDRMQKDGAITVTPSAMFASFASGAFRAAMQAETVVIDVSAGGEKTRLCNPDFTRLSVQAIETEDNPNFVLHDLSDGFLTSLRLGDPNIPSLSIGADSDSYIITFEFGSDHLEDDAAIAFISGLALRLQDPLLQLI